MINGRMVKFLLIGGIGVCTNYAFLYLFAAIFGTDIKNMAVVVVSGLFNTIINYMANHYWAFRDKRAGISFSMGGIKFFITTGIAIGIYAGLVWMFNRSGLDPRASILVATIISFFPKYAMCYYWVWNGKKNLLQKGCKNVRV